MYLQGLNPKTLQNLKPQPHSQQKHIHNGQPKHIKKLRQTFSSYPQLVKQTLTVSIYLVRTAYY